MAKPTQTGTAVEHHAREPFPPFASETFGSQLIWLALTFGFLYLFVAKLAAPRIASILETRRDKIASDLAAAEGLKGETEAAAAAYEKALSDAKANATAIAQSTRAVLNREIEEKKVTVEAELASRLAEADARIAEVKQKAMGEVGGIAAETAEAIVAHLAGSALGKADVASAIKSVLKS